MYPLTRRHLLALLPGLHLRAQEPPTFATDVKVVNLFATVRNKKGEIVRSLGKDDFLLEEDGRPQTVRYFSQESNLPLTLGLLVDTSRSQIRVLGEERKASYQFFRQVLREDRDLAFVIHFDREAELLQDLTSSRAKLEKGLDLIEAPQMGRGRGMGGPGGPGRGMAGGGTVLYDAVALAADEILRKQSGRKALVVLTDGDDHGSKLTLSTAIEAAQRADTLAYSVLFADTQMGGMRMQRRPGGRGRPTPPPRSGGGNGKKVLQRLAAETGAGFFEVSKKLPIDAVYTRIEEELRNQYSLGYVPDRPAPGFHQIKLTTRDKSLTVRTRAGYYGAQ